MIFQVECIHLGPLSPREGEIAEYIIKGFTDKVIARFLGISFRTVQGHVLSIYRKLGISNDSLNLRVIVSNLMILEGMFLVTFP